MWPVGQVVKTAASHAANGSSTLPRVTIFPWRVCIQSSFQHMLLTYIVGVDWSEGPPVPIPNTEVKLTSADDTCRVTGRENR